MVDYEQTIQKIIKNVTNFSFEYDIEEFKNKMYLEEVSDEEIEKLGKEKAQENFTKGIYKIKLAGGKIIDSNSIYEHCKENNILQPVIYLNPDFRYLKWEMESLEVEDQIKNEIKNQLSTNAEINLEKAKKALINEELKSQKVVGYIDNLPIITSNYLEEGKFHIQINCTNVTAIDLINKVIDELKIEKSKYVNEKISSDKLKTYAYLIFVFLVAVWWNINEQKYTIGKWFPISIGLFLFILPFILRLFNFSFADSIFFKEKAIKKYEKEFNNKVLST
ncbi:MAG: hypothetical protein CFE24_14575 [Flavobacterium sp. BFFFF2]|nr:MAG: hypothetical protein CFE24_14575 [Flavobacterium sp. BFFFF2]